MWDFFWSVLTIIINLLGSVFAGIIDLLMLLLKGVWEAISFVFSLLAGFVKMVFNSYTTLLSNYPATTVVLILLCLGAFIIRKWINRRPDVVINEGWKNPAIIVLLIAPFISPIVDWALPDEPMQKIEIGIQQVLNININGNNSVVNGSGNIINNIQRNQTPAPVKEKNN